MLNRDAGLVLTYIFSVSPFLKLVREQYPSIQGQRYFVGGSMRVFSSNQSVVPGRWFSRRMRSEICGPNVRLPTEGRTVEQPERARSAPAPVTPFSISRRLI